MVLDHRHRHNVEDAAGVGVLQIRQLLVAVTLLVGRLNLLVDLPAVGDVEVWPVVAVRRDRVADRRVGVAFRWQDPTRACGRDPPLSGPSLKCECRSALLEWRCAALPPPPMSALATAIRQVTEGSKGVSPGALL